MQVIESILADAAEIAALRRDLHAHPELCFQEQRTSDLIAKQLTDWGIPIHRGLGTTGVVAILKNGTSDRAVIRMRQMLVHAARNLAQGVEPRALQDRDYVGIYGAERILAPGQDWRALGTDRDPIFDVAEAPSVST